MRSVAKQNTLLGGAAFMSSLLAIFGFLSAGSNESRAERALLIICSTLLVVLAVLYLYIILLSVDREPNYFLYDRLAGRNIPPRELTWRMVYDGVVIFIAENLGGEINLWSGSALLSAENKYGPGGAMRPLVAYKMLCDVALDGSGEFFRLFDRADAELIFELSRIIERVGERDMARALVSYKKNRGSPDNFWRYLSGNAKYLQSRMLAYAKRSIEYYY